MGKQNVKGALRKILFVYVTHKQKHKITKLKKMQDVHYAINKSKKRKNVNKSVLKWKKESEILITLCVHVKNKYESKQLQMLKKLQGKNVHINVLLLNRRNKWQEKKLLKIKRKQKHFIMSKHCVNKWSKMNICVAVIKLTVWQKLKESVKKKLLNYMLWKKYVKKRLNC